MWLKTTASYSEIFTNCSVSSRRIIMCSRSEIESVFNDTKHILSILKFAKRSDADLEIIRCKILHGEIKIPRRYRGIIMKLFKKPQTNSKLVGEEFNNWLKQFLHTQVLIQNPLPNVSTANYNDIMKFLEPGKNYISHLENQLLSILCIYGYYLEIFYHMYIVEHLSGRVGETFKVIVQEKFNISNSYANRLRWLGKLWFEYQKIGQLAMSFNKFYNHKQEVDGFFKNCAQLAIEWKIIIDQNDIPMSFSSTNPFTNSNNSSTNPFANPIN